MNLDLLLTDADVVTLDPQRPSARSIGIWQGRIVGVDEEVEHLPARERISLGGDTITPAFHDVHHHMAAFGRSLLEIDASAMTSLEELYQAIRERARSAPAGAWVVASAYDQAALGAHPTRTGLDAAGAGHPVLVTHRTTHLLVASTSVFEQVGAMDSRYEVLPGGFIEREPDGAPTGLVGEQAMIPFRALLKPYALVDIADGLERAGAVLLSEGIASVMEAGIGDSAIVGSSPVELAAYQLARETGRLPVRAQVMVAMENLHPVPTATADGFDLGLDLGVRTGLGDDWLSVGPLKMFTDGALASRTAAMTAPFSDVGGTGVMQFGHDYLLPRARAAHVQGWQLAIHAIGDRAVDEALDLLEQVQAEAPRPHARHRIEHASIVRPEQLARMRDLGVIPVTQGRFVHELGDGAARAVGPDRLRWTYRHRSFLDAGMVVPGSSDRPVVQGAPLPAMQAMVERRTRGGDEFVPDEAVTALQALESYTVHSAHAAREEASKGRIRTGMLADLVVLDANPLRCATAAIGDIQVLTTLVGGHARHDISGRFA